MYSIYKKIRGLPASSEQKIEKNKETTALSNQTSTKSKCERELQELEQIGVLKIVQKNRIVMVASHLNLFRAISRLWLLLLLTLPLDLLWVPYFANLEQRANLEFLPWSLCIVSLLGFAPNITYALSELLERKQREVMTRHARKLLPAMIAFIPFLALLDVVARIGLPIWAVIPVTAAATVPIAYFLAPKIRQHISNLMRSPRNRFIRIVALERRALILGVLPILVARLISIGGAIAERSSLQFIANWHSWFVISAVFMLLLKPRKEEWQWLCSNCGKETQRGLGKLRYCVDCVPYRFNAIQSEQV